MAKSFYRRKDLLKTIVWPKILAILAVVAIMAIAIPGAVFAADPTTVIVNWNGAGTVDGTVVGGTTLATTTFTSFGATANGGQFKANYNVGGDPYGGNKYTSSIDADVTNGIIEYNTLRGAFGKTNGGDNELGGFSSYSFVGTGLFNPDTSFSLGTGSASMTTRTETNAPVTTFTGVDTSLVDNTYGWTGLVHNYQVTGTSAFTIIRQLVAADGDFATVSAVGNGDAYLDNIGSKAGRTAAMCGGPLSGYDFAWGQDFGATNGSGLLTIQGAGNNKVNLTDLAATGGNPATSFFNSTGTLSIVGNGLQTVGTGAAGSSTINQNVGWNTPTLGTFTYNKAIINSQ